MRTAPTVGDLLRHWRRTARRSQLDLASASGVSARHLSFVETGRARPSRSLLLHLAEHLEMPLRERNALVLAAGYAPAYAESDLGADHLRSAREALAHLLEGHEPYPALVLDRWGDVLMTNRGVGSLLRGVDPDLLAAPNAYRIGLHPGGLLPRVREPAAGSRTSATAWSGRCAGAATPGWPLCSGRSVAIPGWRRCSTPDPTRARRSCCSPSPSPTRTVTSPSTRR